MQINMTKTDIFSINDQRILIVGGTAGIDMAFGQGE
jgi:hypothetical protein